MSDGKALAPSTNDYLASVMRGALGVVPFAGSLLSEIAGTVIPNQRLDRLVDFAQELEQRLSGLEESAVRRHLIDAQFTSLVEEAMVQAARAASNERRQHIAHLIANSIDCESLSFLEAEHLLRVLGELNDIEVVRMGWHIELMDLGMNEKSDYYDRHQAILTPVSAVFGDSQEVRDKETLQRSYDEHLARLGLITAMYSKDRNGQPEFDDRTGAPIVHRYEVSRFGHLFARHLGLVGRGSES